MSNALVIVESLAKAKTIHQCLTSANGDYVGPSLIGNTPITVATVLATNGLVRELKSKEGGVDVDNDFKIHYQNIEKTRKYVDEIIDATKNVDIICLATDPDPEGEAAGWHLLELLNEQGLLANKTIKRLYLHEITQQSVQKAMENPRNLNQNIVNSQHARVALDYLVAFNLSPLLWKKIRHGLSTGREHSPALRVILKREQEIETFKSTEYWNIESDLLAKKQKFIAQLTHYQNTELTQFSINNVDITEAIDTTLSILTKGKLIVLNTEKQQKIQAPPHPFTTSTLLQEASRKLGFTALRTMRTARQLYEGVNTGDGEVGLVSYIHTDSISIPLETTEYIKEYIADKYGPSLLPTPDDMPRTASLQISDTACGAILPTSINTLAKPIKRYLTADQFKLYDLIYKRTIASQMVHATVENTIITLDAVQGIFQACSSNIIHPGFQSVYEESLDNEQNNVGVHSLGNTLPVLKKGDKVSLKKIRAEKHFSEPPVRFSEASFVRSLEENGIGRPSSYASIIAKLQNWEYIELEKKQLYPADVGRVVNKFLCQHFSRYVDYNFLGDIENAFSEISSGKKEWIPFIHEFWLPFIGRIKNKEETVDRKDVTQDVINEKCPKCHNLLSIRLGSRGQFISCTAYPKCDYTRNLGENKDTSIKPEVIDGRTCPECQSELIIKQGKYGTFVGCSNYPNCKHIESIDKPEDSGINCPECKKGSILKRHSRNGKTFYSCSEFPSCKYAMWNPPIEGKCPDCGWPVLSLKTSKRYGTEKACPQKSCKYSAPCNTG